MAAGGDKVCNTHFTLVLLLVSYSIGFAAERQNSGMKVRAFHNIPHVLEVVCSGDVLPSGADLLLLTLYSEPSRAKLSSVNLRTHKCTSSSAFASCTVNERDSRQTSLSVLVTDVYEGDSKSFGCEAGFMKDGWMDSARWSTLAVHNRLTTSNFDGLSTVFQVSCSGISLDPSSVVLTVMMYSPDTDKDTGKLASLSTVSGKCTTSSTFSSCTLDQVHRRKSRLVTLITDLDIGESRSYGCTVGYEDGGYLKNVNWSTWLRRNRRLTRGAGGSGGSVLLHQDRHIKADPSIRVSFMTVPRVR